MIESKDYIIAQIKKLSELIAKLLSLKVSTDKQEIRQIVYDSLKVMDLDLDNLTVDNAAVEQIKDERILASLSEIFTIYLSDNDDENLSLLNKLILERLEKSNHAIFKL